MKKLGILLVGLYAGAVGAADGITHFTFPIPDHPKADQAIVHTVHTLDQKAARPVAWGIAGKFKGIDPTVRPDHHAYGIELRFVFQDGTHDWFEPERAFSAKNPGWQRMSGVYQPRKPVKEVYFHRRLATAGEAWYDGVALFEVAEEPKREACRVTEKDGVITMENAFLRFVLLPQEGATASHLVDKRTGVDYAGEPLLRRLFLDQFRIGGECFRRPWKAEVKKATEDEVAVEVRMNGPSGNPYLDVIRLMTLKRDSSALDVAYSWHNQPASMGELVIEPWLVMGLSPRGGHNQQMMYPTAQGVRRVGPGGDVIRHKDVIGGWYAAGADDRRTMAMAFDWANYAETLHYFAGDDNLMSDIVLQPVKIAAGGTFSTAYALFPLTDVKTPAWVENGLAASLEEEGGRLVVRLDAARRGVFNVELAGAYAGGRRELVRTAAFVSPDGTTRLGETLPAAGLESAAVRLHSAGELVFEADRGFTKDYVHRPKKAKAKPAEVKPFVLELRRDLVTPHAEFARPWAGGRPRVLFLTSIHQAREIVELQQRADIEARTVRLAFDENTTTWAMIERFNSYKYFDMNVSLKRELETKFDAIVVSGDRMDPVDAENRAIIAKQLADGTGLVRIGTKNPALTNDAAAVGWIAGNVSPSLLIDCAGRVRAGEAGTHREVMLDYEGRLGLTPFTGYQRKDKPTFRYQDYSLGLVARAIYWAAKRDVPVPADAVRSEEIVAAGPRLDIRHTFWKGPKGVYDWKAEALPRKPSVAIAKFAVDRSEFRIGEAVEGACETDGGEARVELFDGFGRLLATVTPKGGRFALVIPEARTGLLTVRATATKDGKTTDEAEKDVYCRIPYHRPEYPLCLSEGLTTYAYEKEYLLEHRAEIYHQLGINFIRYWESDRTDGYTHMLRHGFDLDFSIYDARLCVFSDLFNRKYIEPYAKTHDKKHLVREPCLHDPAYRAKLDAQTAANVKRIAKFSPITCDCGDENTLTRWSTPFDFCFSEHTLRAFREWLKGEYGTLAKLNAAWRTDYATWEAVLPDTTLEARARAQRTGVKSHAAWADHRRFMELTFCETIERVGKILNRELPNVPLDMSGTQPPNGWTGMDMWLIGKSVKEPAAYASGLLGDYIRSFGRPYIKPWTGYGVQPKTLEYLPWQIGFRFLDAGIYFWTGFNFLLPDYSPTPSAVQYGKTGDEMKTGAARLLRSLEYHDEVLIHYSYGSIHASRIEDRADAFDKCSLNWTQEFLARGIPYRFVAYEEIENGELERTTARTLVLPQSAAISDKGAAAIRAFAAHGGTVVGDDYTGLMDEHCALRERPVLTDVIVREMRLGPKDTDGISAYCLYGRDGAEGRYWGFVRDEQAGEKPATRTISLDRPAHVYDLRAKRYLGETASFEATLESAQAKFFAALPYEVGPVAAQAQGAEAGGAVAVAVQVGLPAGAKACHPVMVEVYDPAGKRSRLYSGVCDAKGGRGTYSFRTALNDPKGVWRVVATDYITGRKSPSSFELK